MKNGLCTESIWDKQVHRTIDIAIINLSYLEKVGFDRFQSRLLSVNSLLRPKSYS